MSACRKLALAPNVCVNTESSLLNTDQRSLFLAWLRDADALARVSLNLGYVALRTWTTLASFCIFIKDHVCSLAITHLRNWVVNLVSGASTDTQIEIKVSPWWAITLAKLLIQSEVLTALHLTVAVAFVSILLHGEAVGTINCWTQADALNIVWHQVTRTYTPCLPIKYLSFKRANAVGHLLIWNAFMRALAGAWLGIQNERRYACDWTLAVTCFGVRNERRVTRVGTNAGIWVIVKLQSTPAVALLLLLVKGLSWSRAHTSLGFDIVDQAIVADTRALLVHQLETGRWTTPHVLAPSTIQCLYSSNTG